MALRRNLFEKIVTRGDQIKSTCIQCGDPCYTAFCDKCAPPPRELSDMNAGHVTAGYQGRKNIENSKIVDRRRNGVGF